MLKNVIKMEIIFPQTIALDGTALVTDGGVKPLFAPLSSFESTKNNRRDEK